MSQSSQYLNFDAHETKIISTIFDRLFPPDDQCPGAVEIGAVDYLDRALSDAYSNKEDWYRVGLQSLNQCAIRAYDTVYHECTIDQQDSLLSQLEAGTLDGFDFPPQQSFFEMLLRHMREGVFSDPIYGGNRDKISWKYLKHPGVVFDYSAEEQLSDQPADKDGTVLSIEDVDFSQYYTEKQLDIPNFDPQRGMLPPAKDVDVVIIGMGGVGGVIAPRLAQAGLKIVALEAGSWRKPQNYLPDELGISFYGRAGLGEKFNKEWARWRLDEDAPNQQAVYGYGKMVNGVGGSIAHYGAWLRRYHPHHLRMRSYVEERWGKNLIPENSTLADWCITYDDIEPYYTYLEHLIGVAGNGDDNPYIPRSKPLPMPPMRPFRLGERYKEVTRVMGHHPYMVPAGQNTIPYAGRSAMKYHPWGVGFGTMTTDRWEPAITTIPEALATGNLDLRTECRVLRILTDGDGQTKGVEYVNPLGERHVQEARTVIVCTYTWENVRLLLMSGGDKHQNGLGNNNGQLGKHFMAKTSTHLGGLFEGENWNRHTGPAGQAVIVDDLLSVDFDSGSHGFVGGGSAGLEMQTLPLRISMETRPDDVPAWGQTYKNHLPKWQNTAYIGIQQDSLPYDCNYIDLDPIYRDKSGLGLPVMRATYQVQTNEHRISDYVEAWADDVLRQMGADKVWRGGRFLSVGSCHEVGGTRMGDDPTQSVVDRNLQVHDTKGLYVYGGSVFPSCPGINPTLSIWATCLQAVDNLIDTLKKT